MSRADNRTTSRIPQNLDALRRPPSPAGAALGIMLIDVLMTAAMLICLVAVFLLAMRPY
jgi:hypothetical protein